MYNSGRELVGMPMPLTLPHEMTAKDLKRRVEAELERYIGSCPGWTLYFSSDKSYFEDCTKSVGEGDEVVELKGKPLVNLIVDWLEDSVPKKVLELGELPSSTG